MRIRKRFHNLMTPPDLSSPPQLSMVVVAVAVSGAAGGKEGEATAAAAGGGGGGGPHGSGDGAGGGGSAGVGGGGLHPNGDLPARAIHECTTKPTRPVPLPLRPLPPETAAAEGEEREDLPLPEPRLRPPRDVPSDHTRGREVPPKRALQDGEKNGDGDSHRRWNTDAYSSPTAAAQKSCLGAEAPELSVGHPDGMPAGSAKSEEVKARWSDEERGFPLERRRGCYRAWFVGDEEDDEGKMVAEIRETKRRPSNTRRRHAAVTNTPNAAAAGTNYLTSAGTGDFGAPTGGGGCAAAQCGDAVLVKEEGEDVISAAVASRGNRGVGNGKKRRSPAVLMEGSRCSRVNGRGWRCCQQTLVGYSLCEHHLGKGRLRSVSSVRCNGRARKKESADGATTLPQLPTPMSRQLFLLSGDGEEEEEVNPGKRRRKKMGMVKARSISSLLHQPDYSTPTAAVAALEPSRSISPSPAPAIAVPPAPPHGGM